MARKKSVRAAEILKDIAIALLALLAVYLTIRTQVTDYPGGWLGTLLQTIRGEGGPLQGPAEPDAPRQVPVYPARIVMTNPDLAHYGAQYDSAAVDALYSESFSVLGEALSVASDPYRVDEDQWRQALSARAGLYFDFLGRYPLETLLAWLERGETNPSLTGIARQLLLAEDGAGGALLYYHNAADGSYYACGTSGAVYSHLLSTVRSRGGVSLNFAFEMAGQGGETAYGHLAPYVLIGSTAPRMEVYRASGPLGRPESQEAVRSLLSGMTVLGFQAQLSEPYQAGEGEWVVNEGQDQLRLGVDGTVSFHAGEGENPRYPVLRAGDTPTLTELLNTVQPIAAGTVGAGCGAARLYLSGLELLPDGSWQIDFDYSLDGAEVLLRGGERAARFLLRDNAVAEFVLYFRTYTAAGEETELLPEFQAAAALAPLGKQGGELLLCYEDGGGDSVRAGWTAR